MFSPHDEDYKKILSQITKQYSQEISQSYHADLTGFSGQLHTDVKVISLCLNMKASHDLPEARTIYLDLVQKFVQMVNDCRQIRPFLSEYPLTYKNVSIVLEFTDADGNLISEDGKICLIGYGNDTIYYSSPSKANTLRNLHKESYPDAIK